MQGTLTITSADGVTLMSAAGLGTITLTGPRGEHADRQRDGRTTSSTPAPGTTPPPAVAAPTCSRAARATTSSMVGRRRYRGLFRQSRRLHVVRNADGSLTISDMRADAPDGSDTLRHFELFQFADGVITLAELLPAVAITSNGGGDSAQASVAENTTASRSRDQSQCVAASGLHDRRWCRCAKFHIDKATGALSFIAAPDFEHPTIPAATMSMT